MLAELWISLDKEEIEVEIIRSKRRSMAIQIRTDGSVVVRVPMHASDRAIKRFVSAHARWIADNRGQMFERRKSWQTIRMIFLLGKVCLQQIRK